MIFADFRSARDLHLTRLDGRGPLSLPRVRPHHAHGVESICDAADQVNVESPYGPGREAVGNANQPDRRPCAEPQHGSCSDGGVGRRHRGPLSLATNEEGAASYAHEGFVILFLTT
jgi:hypothetical protein